MQQDAALLSKLLAQGSCWRTARLVCHLCMSGAHVPLLVPACTSTRHGDELPLEIERLWRTLAHNRRNIIPMLDFLASLGTHMAYQVRHTRIVTAATTGCCPRLWLPQSSGCHLLT